MSLTMSKEQLNSEYKMYENIEEYIEMDDGKRKHHKELHPDLSEVMGKMYERKLIYNKLKIYMDKSEKGEKSERVEEKLQEMLDANNAYFASISDEDKKKYQKIFNSGTEYLGKSVDWQNYRMLFTDLQGMNFDKQVGSFLSQVQERREQVKKVTDAVDAIHERDTVLKDRYESLVGSIQTYKEHKADLKNAKAIKVFKENEREKEDAAINKMFDDAAEKYGNTIESDEKTIKDAKLKQNQLRERVKTYNEHVEHAETQYANTVQEIETGLKVELENDKKELENLKTAKEEIRERYNQVRDELHKWGENYGNENLAEKTDEEKKNIENLKRNIFAAKRRIRIEDIRWEIDKLRNDPDFNLNECIYGKEDNTLREKYPILDWLKDYMDFQKESEELNAKQVENGELDLLVDDVENENTEVENEKTEEIENNDVEIENDGEEINNDDVENENTEVENENIEEKKEVKPVEGVTKYVDLLDAMYDNLDKFDDVYWDEVQITEKKMSEDIKMVYDRFDKEMDDCRNKAQIKNDEIDEKQKQVDEKEKDVATKLEDAKGLRDRLKEQYLLNNFSPTSVTNRMGVVGAFEKFKGDYTTFPEQVDGVLKLYDEEIKAKEENIANLKPLYNADIEKATQARKDYDARESTYKAEISQLNKQIEDKEYMVKVNSLNYNNLKPLINDLKNACKDTFSIKTSQEYKEVEMVNSIKQQAAEWLKIEGLHTGNHKNSVEYDRMITAFKMVAEYPNSLNTPMYTDKFKGVNLPTRFDDLLAFTKEQAENYKKEKDKQWRPLASRLRNHRNTMTKFMIGFAEKGMKGMAAIKELVELDHFIESRGRSQGLDKDELIQEVMEAADIKIPEREKTSANKTMTTQVENKETQKETKETQKEAKEIKEPELEDGGGMSMG